MLNTNTHPTHIKTHSKSWVGRGMTSCIGAWLDLGPIGGCSPSAAIPLEGPCPSTFPEQPNQQPKNQGQATDILGESGLSQVR